MRRIWRQLSIVRLILAIASWLIKLGIWELRVLRAVWKGPISLRFIFKPLVFIFQWSYRLLFNRPINYHNAVQDSVQLKEIKRSVRRQALRDLRQQPIRNFIRPAIAFAVLAFFIVLPFKFYDGYRFFSRLESRIMNYSHAAIGNIDQAKSSALANDFETAQSDLSQASNDFMMVSQELAGVDGLVFQLAKLTPNKKLKLAGHGQTLAQIGVVGSELAIELTSSADALLNKRSGKALTQVLDEFQEPAKRALLKLDELDLLISDLNPSDLPDEYGASFAVLKDKMQILQISLSELVETVDYLQVFLGKDQDKRYLMIFQNNTEARATGGFMGSFAVIDFKQGQIKKMTTPGGGTYDTESGLRRLIQSPQPLSLIKARWFFWDCNWWPDWPRSAEKIMWFYEKSDGPTVDGVISLTPNVVMKLIEVLGPVDLSKDHQVVIDSDNFMETVQTIVEQKDTDNNAPKQIISDMLEQLMTRLSQQLDREDLIKIIKVLESSLNEKDILIYLTDRNLQSKVTELAWDGALKSTNGDYLAVINTNIGGGKSDKKIIQTITHDASLTNSGEIINTVTIVRDHQGDKSDVLSGVRNVNWLRVYVPLGSHLISSEGWRQPDAKFKTVDPAWEFDQDLINERDAEIDPLTNTRIYREQGKTVFANWSMVDPGEIAVIKLVYKLPSTTSLETTTGSKKLFKYSFLSQKQSGAHNSEIRSRLILPDNMSIIWSYPSANLESFYQQDIDRAWGYLLQQNN